MKGEDGKTAQLRRSLIGGADPEMLLMETIVNGASMRQRYQCESRPVRTVRAATAREATNQGHARVPAMAASNTHEAETSGLRQTDEQ
eukprot:COSAG02_NODE_62978_length_264_cov_0.927273_1_plen_87_part_11